jgi:predicted PurR-regulated permease PerM
MFMLCIAQLGPGLVLVPAVIWLFATGDTRWGIFLAIVSVAAITVDNFVRPVLIRRGVHLPLLLILAGVIGGLIAFGLIGIFLGPMILAVAYTLFRAWLSEVDGLEPSDS